MAKTSKRKRSLAAKKGWKTRRANARLEAEKIRKRSRTRKGKRYVKGKSPVAHVVRKSTKKRKRKLARPRILPKKKKKSVKRHAPKKKVTRKVRVSKKTEYQINARYEPAHDSAKVEVQISAKGPSSKSREEVIQAVEYKMRLSREGLEGRESDPRGWELHIIFWEKRGKKFFGDDSVAWNQLSFLFGLGEVEVSGATKNKKSRKVFEEEDEE